MDTTGSAQERRTRFSAVNDASITLFDAAHDVVDGPRKST